MFFFADCLDSDAFVGVAAPRNLASLHELFRKPGIHKDAQGAQTTYWLYKYVCPLSFLPFARQRAPLFIQLQLRVSCIQYLSCASVPASRQRFSSWIHNALIRIAAPRLLHELAAACCSHADLECRTCVGRGGLHGCVLGPRQTLRLDAFFRASYLQNEQYFWSGLLYVKRDSCRSVWVPIPGNSDHCQQLSSLVDFGYRIVHLW